jgi:methyl coenzyme M reductase subunit D
MGRAARLKRERRVHATADIEVVCPGMLEILSVGKGDIKLTIDSNDPGEVNDARKIIEEMLAKGYGIFVETDKGLSRVKKFNPKRMTYVISEVVENADVQPVGKRTRERDVPVAGSRAKAIGRTAGG